MNPSLNLSALKERIDRGFYTYTETLELIKSGFEFACVDPNCPHIRLLEYYFQGDFLVVYFHSNSSKGYLYNRIGHDFWLDFASSAKPYDFYTSKIKGNSNFTLELPTKKIKTRKLTKQKSHASDKHTDEDSHAIPDAKELESSLEKHRERLLDLTLRNPLISFNETGAKVIPIIEELPDELYKSLVEGGVEMSLDPYFDNNQEGLAHDIQHADKPIYGLIETRSEVDDKLDSEIVIFGKPTKKKTQKLAELPNPNSDDFQFKDQYVDDRIQTSLTWKRYEQRLANVLHSYEEFIHSTGENYLYLALGFIEWFQPLPTEDSGYKKRYSPLLLIPVEISSQTETIHLLDEDGELVETEQYIYKVKHSGEDILTNNTFSSFLKSKKELSTINIPELNTKLENPIERYFKQIETILSSLPVEGSPLPWSVKRKAGLSFFASGKEIMYRDLNPKKWDLKKLYNNELLKTALGYPSAGSGRENWSSDDDTHYYVDPIHTIVPADSSQMDAISMALKCKPMVLQGPPGTGKSQTITNLIASAMSKGLKVLFVAEKNEALNVVADRLANANLGEYCLELHSQKAKPKHFAEQLYDRLETHENYASLKRRATDKKTTRLLGSLEQIKNRTNAYGIDLTQHIDGEELFKSFWNREKNYGSLMTDRLLNEELISEVNSFLSSSYKNTLTQSQRQEAIKQLEIISKLWGEGVLNYASYWKDFLPRKMLSSTDSNALESIFRAQTEILERLSVLLQKNAGFPLAILRDLKLLLKLVDLDPEDELLSSKALKYDEAFLNELSLKDSHSTEIKNQLGLIDGIKPRIVELWSKEQSIEFQQVFKASEQYYELTIGTDRLQNNIRTVELLLNHPQIGGANLQELVENLKLVTDYKQSLEQLEKNIITLLGLLGTTTVFPKKSDIHKLVEFSTGFLHISLNKNKVLKCVSKELLQDFRYNRARNEAQEKNSELRAKETALQEYINKPEALEVTEVDFISEKLTGLNQSFWKYPLWGEAKKAKQKAKAIAIDKKKILDSNWIENLKAASVWIGKKEEFKKNDNLINNIGTSFSGYDTDWASLDEAKLLTDKIKTVFPTDYENIVQKISADDFNYEEIVQTLDQIQYTLRGFEGEKLQLILNESPRIDPEQESLHVSISETEKLITNLSKLSSELHELELLKELDFQTFKTSLLECLSISELHTELSDKARKASTINSILTSVTHIEIGCSDWNKTHLSRIHDTLIQLNLVRSKLALQDDNTAHLLKLKENNSDKHLIEFAQKIRTVWKDYVANLDIIERDFADIQEHCIHAKEPSIKATESWIDTLISSWEIHAESFNSLPYWSDYTVSKNELANLDCLNIVDFAQEQALEPDELVVFANLVFYDVECRNLLQDYPALSSTRRVDLEKDLKDFQDYEHALPSQFQQTVVNKLDKRSLNTEEGINRGPVKEHTEMSLLIRESTKSRSHLPIRHTISKATDSLQKLFPCWMMSPASIAKFCAQDDVEFDLLVIDEASQVKPEDCLGAFMRTQSAVIVGDDKQMPPSKSFNRSFVTDDDDDEPEIAESILEKALASFPETTLKWHYRSKHQDLISFSNLRYYNESLIIPPSKYEVHPKYGVKWNYIENATYAKSINSLEAEKVSDALAAHVTRESSKPRVERKSVGVVVMNSPQATLIRKIIDKKKLDDKEFRRVWENYHDDEMPKALIVNLERVQGDERDIIIIGFTFGTGTIGGSVARRFGSINNEGGKRRLNVLITRAIERMEVYSSMTADQILGGGDVTNENVKDLADFLRFAETGKLVDHGTHTNKDYDSPFEESVANIVSSMGYEVIPQVGVDGFRIDLGIRQKGRHDYICGIECDGATYHSHPIARDRDVLRQSILESRGWEIYRIWSTDWFRNRDAEIKRLRNYLSEAIKQ